MSSTEIRPIHRDEARRFVWGLGGVVVLAVVGAIGLIVQTGGVIPGRTYTYVTATFANAGTLDKGSQVKEDGIAVGTVSEVAYRDGKAVATLRLDGKRGVHADAGAYIANGSALGKKYVALDPGSSSAGPLGAAGITEARTTSDQDVNDILAVFDPATRTALRGALGQLGEGLTSHGEDLNAALAASPSLLADLRAVAGRLTAAPADVPGLLASANRLVGRFRGHEAQIAQLLDNARTTVGSLSVDRGRPLGRTVAELPAALTSARAALDSLHAPLGDAEVALRTLRPGGRTLGLATPALRGFLRDSRGPLDRVDGVARTASPALADLTGTLHDARPLIVPVGAAISSLDQLLFGLSGYAGDMGRFFSQAGLLQGTLGSDDKHYFAAELTAATLAAVAGVPDPLYHSEPYPCPGTAADHSVRTDCRGGVR